MNHELIDRAISEEREALKAHVDGKIKAVEKAVLFGRLSDEAGTYTKNILSALIGDVDAELHIAEETQENN